MEEIKKDEKKEGEEFPSADAGEGDKSELVKQTDAANAAAERLEKAKKELDAAEALRRLGGGSEAGQEPVKPKEEEPVSYMEKALSGELNKEK